MQTLKRGILIGAAGQQGSEYFELLKGKVNWVALVDLNLEALSSKYSSYDIPHYSQLPDFISNDTCDFALVAVPHNQHMEVSKHLIERGVAVIKEKPLAQNNVELEVYQKLVSTYQVPIYTIVQRSFHPLLQLAQKRLAEIGPVYSFQYDYFMSLKTPTSGWRADRSIAGGGVVIDMGYHTIDVLNRFFGEADSVKSSINYCFDQTRASALEDSAQIVLEYKDLGIHGQLHLERHHYQKRECLEVLGEQGAIVVTPTSFSLYGRDGQLRDQQQWMGSKIESLEKMFLHYLSQLDLPQLSCREAFLKHFDDHCMNVRTVDSIYSKQNTKALKQIAL